MKPAIAYIISFAIVSVVMALQTPKEFTVGTFGPWPNQVTMRSVNGPWYKCIRASFSPSKYVFPIVWTKLA